MNKYYYLNKTETTILKGHQMVLKGKHTITMKTSKTLQPKLEMHVNRMPHATCHMPHVKYKQFTCAYYEMQAYIRIQLLCSTFHDKLVMYS